MLWFGAFYFTELWTKSIASSSFFFKLLCAIDTSNVLKRFSIMLNCLSVILFLKTKAMIAVTSIRMVETKQMKEYWKHYFSCWIVVSSGLKYNYFLLGWAKWCSLIAKRNFRPAKRQLSNFPARSSLSK